MKPAHELKVFQVARENLRTIRDLSMPRFGDIENQVQRAALSVVSNIAEATGTRTDRDASKFFGIARASNNELHAQLLIASDLGAQIDDALPDRINHVTAMLTKLIKHLS